MKKGNTAIIFDFMRTIYDPEEKRLINSAKEILHAYSEKHDLYLISYKEGHKLDLIRELGIEHYFTEIVLVEEKNIPLFEKISNRYHRTYIIGDRLDNEIKIGSELDLETIWYKNGKFANENNFNIDPKHIVLSLKELLEIIKLQ